MRKILTPSPSLLKALQPRVSSPLQSQPNALSFLLPTLLAARMQSITLLNAAVSSSTSDSNSSLSCCALTAQLLKYSSLSSQPRFPAERFATIPPSDAPNAPINAATEPPPGAGESLNVSLQNSRTIHFYEGFFRLSRFDLEFNHLFVWIERLQFAQAHGANRNVDQFLF